MQAHSSHATRRMGVTVDGKDLVSHAGTALLSEPADRSKAAKAMSVALCSQVPGARSSGILVGEVHDRFRLSDHVVVTPEFDRRLDAEVVPGTLIRSVTPNRRPRNHRRGSTRTPSIAKTIAQGYQ